MTSNAAMMILPISARPVIVIGRDFLIAWKGPKRQMPAFSLYVTVPAIGYVDVSFASISERAYWFKSPPLTFTFQSLFTK
jgi:hypothetical protein